MASYSSNQQNRLSDILTAGIDEAGRGPLAGAVFAAAVIFDPEKPLPSGIKDSKLLSAKKREALFQIITTQALAFAIGRAEVEEIDRLNILQASLLAMRRAAEGLTIKPTRILVDGNICPKFNFICEAKAIINGDFLETVISAASILAKVSRDRDMLQLDAKYPAYGFAKHKGYGTKAHLAALAKFGPTPIHRRSFAPVRKHLLLNK